MQTQAQGRILHLAASRVMQLGTVPMKESPFVKPFTINVDDIVGEGITGFGIKGSGKTNTLALFAEQFAQFNIPMVVFDFQGDLLSLVDVFPRGVLGTVHNAPRGKDIYTYGLQVVYNMDTWSSDEHAVCAMMQIVNEMFQYASSLPVEDRVPCLIFLDEASDFIPQSGKTARSLDKATIQALRETFQNVAERGRKRGLIPCLFAQRISELHKSVMAQSGVFVLMKQTSHTDKAVYREYIHTGMTASRLAQMVESFKKGQAIVKLPGGKQVQCQFDERASRHISHTPTVERAIHRYADMPLPNHEFASFAESSIHVLPVVTPDGQYISKRDRCLQVITSNPSLTMREVARIVGTVPSTAHKAFEIYRASHPIT